MMRIKQDGFLDEVGLGKEQLEGREREGVWTFPSVRAT